MKLGPVKDKTNKTASKYFEVMWANCDFTIIFPIYGQFGSIPKSDSGGIVSKTYILINSNLLSYKH